MPRLLLAFLILLAAAVPARAGWNEARTRHLIIYSEQKAEDLRAYAERLERFDAAVRRFRRMEDPPLTDGGKLTLYVLPSVPAVQRLAGQEDVLGFYIGRAAGSVAFFSHRPQDGDRRPGSMTPEYVFQHEYMHHLMLGEQKSALTPWLIEGIAEFFGTAEVERDGEVVIGRPPQARGWAVLEDVGFNAEALLAARPAKTALESESIYGKGWALTHMLAFSAERAGQLDTYLKALGGGEEPLAAARTAFGDLKLLDRELDRYAGGEFRAFRVAPGPAPEVKVRALSPGQSAIMPVRIRSDRGVNEKTAPAVAADARRIAAAFPNDGFVQATLAETEFDVKDYRAAIAAADRALAADPANVQAMIYKGRSLLELARAEPAKADWAEVRRWFVRANRADLENAEPLWLFYDSFRSAGQQPRKSAVHGLLYAQALVPQDEGLRADAVAQLLVDERFEMAERLFGALVFDPHAPINRLPLLRGILERIRAKDGAGALAMMEEYNRPSTATPPAEGRRS